MSVATGVADFLGEDCAKHSQHECLFNPPEPNNSILVNISSASCRWSHSPSLVLSNLCFSFFRLPPPPLPVQRPRPSPPGAHAPEWVLCCLELRGQQALQIKPCRPEVPPLPKCSRMCFVQFSQLFRAALGRGAGGPLNPKKRKRGRGRRLPGLQLGSCSSRDHQDHPSLSACFLQGRLEKQAEGMGSTDVLRGKTCLYS